MSQTRALHTILLTMAALVAWAPSAGAEDGDTPDTLFLAWGGARLKAKVLGFRGEKLEIRSAVGIARVETRFLRSIAIGIPGQVLFEDDFRKDGIGKTWETIDGDWKIENGALVGSSDRDNAVIRLCEEVRGDMVLELDAEIRTDNPRGGLHVSMAGQHWFFYPTWGGIYPPYQEKLPDAWWTRDGAGYVLRSHFRLARKGNNFEFSVANKPYIDVVAAPVDALDGRLTLAAAHKAEVRYRNIRLSGPSMPPDAAAFALKMRADVLLQLKRKRTVFGTLQKGTGEALVAEIPLDGRPVALDQIEWIVFPPSEALEPEFEIDAAAKTRIADMIRELGNDDPEVRDRSTRELLSLGPLAIAALRGAISAPDAETAMRAQLILQQLEGVVPEK